jgi:hypothetical protein
VQRRNDRHIFRGHVLQKIQAVHMHDINRIFSEDMFDCRPLLRVRGFQRFGQ